jgi:hypothetical protein
VIVLLLHKVREDVPVVRSTFDLPFEYDFTETGFCPDAFGS